MLKFFKVSIILCSTLSVFIFYSGIAFAKTETFTLQGEDIDKNKPVITVEIGGFSGWNDTAGWSKGTEYCPAGTKAGVECLQISWISDYIVAVYKYGVGVAAVLAVVMIMIGGFVWLMSGGNSTRVSTAKDFIVSAMSGLLLALFSFVILYAVNPRLVSLSPITSPLRPVTGQTADHFENVPKDSFVNSRLSDLQKACQGESTTSCPVDVLDYKNYSDFNKLWSQALEDAGVRNPADLSTIGLIAGTLSGVDLNESIGAMTVQPNEQLNQYISENATYQGENQYHFRTWEINDTTYTYIDKPFGIEPYMDTGNSAMLTSQNADDFVPYWLVVAANASE